MPSLTEREVWGLFKDGKEVERHNAKVVCNIAAVERGWLVLGSPDFPSDPTWQPSFIRGVEVRRIENKEDSGG